MPRDAYLAEAAALARLPGCPGSWRDAVGALPVATLADGRAFAAGQAVLPPEPLSGTLPCFRASPDPDR
jgi:hypothetical protein